MKLFSELSELEKQIFNLDASLSLFKALTYSCRDMNEDDVEKALHGMLNSLERINGSIRLEFDKVWEAVKKSDKEENVKLEEPKENMNPPVLIFQLGDEEDPHLSAQLHISKSLPSSLHKCNYTLLNKDMGYEVRVYEHQSV